MYSRRPHDPEPMGSTLTLVDTTVGTSLEPITTLVDSTMAHATVLKDPLKENHHLTGVKLCLVVGSFMTLVALDGLDQMVLSTALVTITSQFNAVSDIAWITSAFSIAQASCILIFGKILNIAPPKIVLLISAALFELGSLLCAVSPSVHVLILGRVIAGIGAGGIWTSILSTVGRIAPIHQRSLLMSLISSAFGFFSAIGPIVGGVLSERVSWRWCFYINLPIGCLGILGTFLFMPNMPTLTTHEISPLKTWLQLDWIGTFLSTAGVVLFLTGLQLGGVIKPWNDAAVIVTIVLGSVVFLLFIAWEIRVGPKAILPTHMFTKRTLVGCYMVAGFMHWAMVLITIYLPVLFQLRGHSVIRSSVENLPLVGAGIVGGILSGILVAQTGMAWIWLFFPPFFGTLGFIFLVVSNINTSLNYLYGLQVLIGFSLGSSVQHTVVVVQAEFADREDLVPQATSLISFSGVLFSAIGTATSGALFSGILRTQVNKLDLAESIKSVVLESIDSIFVLPNPLREMLMTAYTVAVCRSFLSGAVVCFLASVSALLISRKRVPNV